MCKYLLCPQKHIWLQDDGPFSLATGNNRCPVCNADAVALPGETVQRPKTGERMLYVSLGLTAVAVAIAWLATNEAVRVTAGITGVMIGGITVLALMISAPWIIRRHRGDQARGITQVAETLGLSFCRDVPLDLRQPCSCVPHLKRSPGAHLNDLAHGQWGGYQVIVGILTYDTEGTRSYGHCRGDPIVILVNAFPAKPTFRLDPTGVLKRLVNCLRPPEIDLQGTVERGRFVRLYRLQGGKEPLVRELFNDRAVEFFVNNTGWCVHCEQGTLILWRALGLWGQARRGLGHGMKTPSQRLPHAVLELLYGAEQIMGVLTHFEESRRKGESL